LKINCLDNLNPPLVSSDGQEAFPSPPVFPVEVSVSATTFPLLEGMDHSHFRLLRHKLKWG